MLQRRDLFPNELQREFREHGFPVSPESSLPWKFYTGATLYKSAELIWNIFCATPTRRVLCRAESRARDGFRTRRGTAALSPSYPDGRLPGDVEDSLCSQDSDIGGRSVGSLALSVFAAIAVDSRELTCSSNCIVRWPRLCWYRGWG